MAVPEGQALCAGANTGFITKTGRAGSSIPSPGTELSGLNIRSSCAKIAPTGRWCFGYQGELNHD